MNIGERIKARRKELGMSVEQLAKAIGKNRATVYRYESAEINSMPADVLIPIAQALHITPAELLCWPEQPKKELPSDSPQMRLINIFSKLNPENKKRLLELAIIFLQSQSDE